MQAPLVNFFLKPPIIPSVLVYSGSYDAKCKIGIINAYQLRKLLV